MQIKTANLHFNTKKGTVYARKIQYFKAEIKSIHHKRKFISYISSHNLAGVGRRLRNQTSI